MIHVAFSNKPVAIQEIAQRLKERALERFFLFEGKTIGCTKVGPCFAADL
jgi:hypothetical protein